MAERPILARFSSRDKSSPAGSPAPNQSLGAKNHSGAAYHESASSILLRSSSNKPNTSEYASKHANTPVSESKGPIKPSRADSKTKAKHLGYNSDAKPTAVTAKNLWRERLSSSSAGKKQHEEKDQPLEFPKWSRDDPRFKTCDSVSTAVNLKGSTLAHASDAGDSTIEWSSVGKSGQRQIEKRKFNFEKKNTADKQQTPFNSNFPSKRKDAWAFGRSHVPLASSGCLDLDQDSNVKTRLFEDSKIGIQTTEELKGMITQQKGTLISYAGRFDHLLSDTPRVAEQSGHSAKVRETKSQKNTVKRKPNSSLASNSLDSKIFNKFDSPSLDSFDRIESNKSQLQSILNGRRSYNGQSTLNDIGAIEYQKSRQKATADGIKGVASLCRAHPAEGAKVVSPSMRLRLAQSCASIKAGVEEASVSHKEPSHSKQNKLSGPNTNSRNNSPKHGKAFKSPEFSMERASVVSIKEHEYMTPSRLAANLARLSSGVGVTISPSLISGLNQNSNSAVMTVSPARKASSALGSSRSSNVSSFCGIGLRKSSASKVTASRGKEGKVECKRQASVDCISTKPSKFTHTYYMEGLKYHYRTALPDSFTPIYKDHFQLSFNSVRFSKMLDHNEVDEFIKATKLELPIQGKYQGKLTVVFDLDETLVHCEAAKTNGGEIISVVLPNGRKIDVGETVYPDSDLHQTRSSRDPPRTLEGRRDHRLHGLSPRLRRQGHRLARP